MKEQALVVYCTVPNIDEAKSIARLLINKKLAACCNVIPGLVSIYRWQGKMSEESEVLLLIKTSQKKYEQLEKEIKMIHSYSIPEIIATPIVNASSAYMDWIFEMIGEK
jgi:periplasmic divalent cation tolerance protein